MEDLLDVAKYMYDKVPGSSDKKIQKLTYYAYCWYIVKHNTDADHITDRLVSEHPEAWIHGPVFDRLFDEMTYNREGFKGRVVSLCKSTEEFLNGIIYIYGKFTANRLEDLTHSELPWQNARGDLDPNEKSRNLIRDDIIFSYYKN